MKNLQLVISLNGYENILINILIVREVQCANLTYIPTMQFMDI